MQGFQEPVQPGIEAVVGIRANVVVDDPPMHITGFPLQVTGEIGHQGAFAMTRGGREQDGAEGRRCQASRQGVQQGLTHVRTGQEILQAMKAESGMGQVALLEGTGHLVGGKEPVQLRQQVILNGLAELLDAGIAIHAKVRGLAEAHLEGCQATRGGVVEAAVVRIRGLARLGPVELIGQVRMTQEK